MENQTWWDAACNLQPEQAWQSDNVTNEFQFEFCNNPLDAQVNFRFNDTESFMLLCFLSEAFDGE